MTTKIGCKKDKLKKLVVRNGNCLKYLNRKLDESEFNVRVHTVNDKESNFFLNSS